MKALEAAALVAPSLSHRFLGGRRQPRINPAFRASSEANGLRFPIMGAPAIITSIRVLFFLGEHHHSGTPEQFRPRGFIRFPDAKNIYSLIRREEGPPATEQVKDGSSKLFSLLDNLSQALASNDVTETLICRGPAQIPAKQSAVSVETWCDAYFIGVVTYRRPSQGIETMSFCLKKDSEAFVKSVEIMLRTTSARAIPN